MSPKSFDLEIFNLEYPVYEPAESTDPFTEKINEREKLEPLNCCSCLYVYDRGTGKVIGEVDIEGDGYVLGELCGECCNMFRQKEHALKFE